MNTAISSLKRAFPGIVQEGVRLREISRWRIGGVADCLVSPRSVEELAALRSWIYERGLASIIFGETSNLLFSDEGLRAIAIRIGRAFSRVEVEDQSIHALAGTWVPGLARTALSAGLTGLEHTCGIPGTLGGLICMNGGSQRKGISEALQLVTSITISGDVLSRPANECGFSYRRSIFQENGEAIVSATLGLQPTRSKASQRTEMLEILRSRRRKFPQKEPNCGSVFVSNPSMYAQYGPPGKVIEEAGLKGFRIGGAIVSPSHANFIINEGPAMCARSSDVLSLIRVIKEKVLQRTGYSMEVEVRRVDPDGRICKIE